MSLKWTVGARLAAAVLAAGLAPAARAENWPHWRGPLFNGSTTEKNLPASWSTTENVAWRAPLPGPSGATPVIWGDHVFVTSADAGDRGLWALALAAKDGQVLWKHRVAEGRPAPQNTCASPSPATDGQRVVFLYATGDLVAFDLAGKALWARNLGEEFGKLALKFGYSSSPVFHEGRLYVAVMRRPWSYAYSPGRTTPADTAQTLDSFLLAIDPATGKGLWEADRTPKTTDESYESYASPIPHEAGGRREILLSGGDLVTGHDAATGRLLWVAGWNPDRADLQRLIPSVTVGGGRVYVPVARGGPILAFPAGCTGPVPDARIAWRYTGTATDSSTPLFYDGILYVLGSDSRALAALDPATGRTLWEGGLGVRSVLRASPTGADGKVYCLSQDGDVIVLAAGREQKVLSRFAMGEGPMQASIAAAGGRLYVRTSRSLYCIGPRP